MSLCIRRRSVILGTVVCAVFLGFACSNDSKPPQSKPAARTSVSIPLENALTDVFIPANTPTQVVVTFHTPVDIGVITAASIDVAGTVQHGTASAGSIMAAVRHYVASLFESQATAEATIRVGNDPATVCEQTIVYGPFSVEAGFLSSPSPDSIELGQPTIQILNAGYAVLCMMITTSTDVTFSLDEIEAKVASQSCPTPSNFSGDWAGNYLCGNSCGSEFGGDVTLTVTQDGASAQYVDGGGDVYTGTICGTKFRFERIDLDEIERGTMTLIDATHAVKHSTWRGRNYPYCWGDCTDTLTRQ